VKKSEKKGFVKAKVISTSLPFVDKDRPQKYILEARDYIPFGSDNLFMEAIARLNRKATVNRGILRRKKRFLLGDGFNYDDKNLDLKSFVDCCNANNETLRKVTSKLISDDLDFGNCFFQLVTDGKKSYVNIYHVDATECRKHREGNKIVMHPNWENYEGEKEDALVLSIYPEFTLCEDGLYRSMIHVKEYEPTFKNYGVPDWIAGMQVSGIAYKTDTWNISRLDNSFKGSGVLIVDGEFNNEEEAADLKDEFDEEFTGEGNTGKVLFIAKSGGASEGTKFVSLSTNEEGDWTKLHAQAGQDLIIAHNWSRAFSGFNDTSGFDTDKLLNEYQMLLNTVILDKQNVYLELYKQILRDVIGLDAEDLDFINKPPIKVKPKYMKIWEARKLDGLDFDENDPEQQQYLGTISNSEKTKKDE